MIKYITLFISNFSISLIPLYIHPTSEINIMVSFSSPDVHNEIEGVKNKRAKYTFFHNKKGDKTLYRAILDENDRKLIINVEVNKLLLDRMDSTQLKNIMV